MFLTTLLGACLFAPQEPIPSGLEGETLNLRLAFRELDNGLRHRHEPVARGKHTCVLLGVRTGVYHDPNGQTGLARTLEYTLRLLQEEREDKVSTVVNTLGPATLISATVPNDRVPALLQFYAELLGDKIELSDDLLARAIAQAQLRADDEAKVIPGLMHYWRARRALLPGDPRSRQSCGVPAEMAKLSAAEVRARFRAVFSAKNAFLVTLGGLEQASVERLVDGVFRQLQPGPSVSSVRVVPDSGGDVKLEFENPRADAVFETAAFRAPGFGEPDFIPFLLAMHLLRVGVMREQWQYRGGEAQAAFPWFVFSMLQNPGVVLINRRGVNGGDIERPRREIESVLSRMRAGALGVEDIKQAVLWTSRMLQLPPYDSATMQRLAVEPRVLQNPAFVVAMYEVWRWPTDLSPSVIKVKLLRIHEVMQECLHPDRLLWVRTLPSRRDTKAGQRR